MDVGQPHVTQSAVKSLASYGAFEKFKLFPKIVIIGMVISEKHSNFSFFTTALSNYMFPISLYLILCSTVRILIPWIFKYLVTDHFTANGHSVNRSQQTVN